MKDNIEKGDVIGAEWLNAKITLADLMQIVRAGPGISIKRIGKNIVVSTLRQGGSGGGGTSDTSHHVVADYADLEDEDPQATGDVAALTTPNLFAYKYGTGDTDWFRVMPFRFETADPASAPSVTTSGDGHFWLNTTAGKLWMSLDDEWLCISHIESKVS